MRPRRASSSSDALSRARSALSMASARMVGTAARSGVGNGRRSLFGGSANQLAEHFEIDVVESSEADAAAPDVRLRQPLGKLLGQIAAVLGAVHVQRDVL